MLNRETISRLVCVTYVHTAAMFYAGKKIASLKGIPKWSPVNWKCMREEKR